MEMSYLLRLSSEHPSLTTRIGSLVTHPIAIVEAMRAEKAVHGGRGTPSPLKEEKEEVEAIEPVD